MTRFIISSLVAVLVLVVARELLGFETIVICCFAYLYAEYKSKETDWRSNTVFIFTDKNSKFEFDCGFDTIKVNESVFFDYEHSGIVESVRYTIDNKMVTRIVLIKPHESIHVIRKRNSIAEIIKDK